MARRARRRRGDGSKRSLIGLAAIAGVLAVSVGAALVVWFIVARSGSGDSAPKAVIIDQLAFNVPNQEFVDQARTLLEDAGYRVDYVPTNQVTVNYYRELPSKGYDFVLFRTHADRLSATAKDGSKFDDVVLFSSEEYDRSKYVPDQAANRLVIATYHQGGEEYFGVAPGFFENSKGSFKGATLVVMGCEGFLTDRTAEAFVNQMGAKAYISWNETVTAPHTDEATEALLRHLLVEKKPAQSAVAMTMADVGPDPIYGSRLVAYPRS